MLALTHRANTLEKAFSAFYVQTPFSPRRVLSLAVMRADARVPGVLELAVMWTDARAPQPLHLYRVCCFVLLVPTPLMYRVPRVSPGVTARKLFPPRVGPGGEVRYTS